MELIHEEDGYEVWWGPKDIQVGKETQYGYLNWYVHMPYAKPKTYTQEDAMANYMSARRKIEAAVKSLDELKERLKDHISEFAEPMLKLLTERDELREQRKRLKAPLDIAAAPYAAVVSKMKERETVMDEAEREALTAERVALKEKLDAVKKPYDAFMKIMRERQLKLSFVEDKLLRKVRRYGKWKNQQGIDPYEMDRALMMILKGMATTAI